MNNTTTYSGIYRDENGMSHTVTITLKESIEALNNDLRAVLSCYNRRTVQFKLDKPAPGEAMRLHVTVKAPSHYLTGPSDTTPKACSQMEFWVIAYPGYPLTKCRAFYAKDHYLASPNVFISGNACIDEWVVLTSNLSSVVEKLIHDVVHDPSVSRYDSMANPTQKAWHQRNVAAGNFPTVKLSTLYV